MVGKNEGRYETRVRDDGAIHVPAEILDRLAIYPGSRIRVFRDGDRLVVEKVEAVADPFAAAARGPDLSAMEKIQREQKESARKARAKFEELLKKPPEVRPEDNKDLWR
ncbi:MAG: AbrB/MazE/SpoVT family DNA-binding domain-containing protein [Planctomycetes bacterium]|jgi:bifunctional DNA-binding transcriptional regulator/antitoxin component of YhaV-PrlF toxin-antitoxin module|nr:AbrB/MazE/SpoVT family DNA-binding domain-containing protein [Planctomycetota bacterium]